MSRILRRWACSADARDIEDNVQRVADRQPLVFVQQVQGTGAVDIFEDQIVHARDLIRGFQHRRIAHDVGMIEQRLPLLASR